MRRGALALRQSLSCARSALLPPRAPALAFRPLPQLATPPLARSLSSSSTPVPDSPAPPPLDSTPPVRGARDDAFLMWESPAYSRFVNMIMKSGKKQTARAILWSTFVRLRDGGHDPQDIFHGALENVRPMLEMRSFRSGPVPFPLNPKRAEGQAMKWIVAAARKRSGASFDRLLAQELLAAHQNKGSAVQKREEVHRTAVANQAAAHFRWRVGSHAPPGSIDMDKKRFRPIGRRSVKRLQGAT
jgi:small subunit ribosomal protein S7